MAVPPMQQAPDAPTPAAALYAPTPRETAALEAHSTRRAGRAPLVRLKTVETAPGKTTVSVDHPDPVAGELLFCEQLATDDGSFSSVVAEQLGFLAMNQEGTAIDDQTLSRHLSVVRGIAPTHEIETLLACQMAAVHMLTMATAVRARSATAPRRDVELAQVNKLTRTFAAQIETLKRYRSKGEQRVVVEHQHVHVHPGGQAVVGTVQHGGGGGAVKEKEGQPHERSVSERAPVRSPVKANGATVPGTGNEGLAGMPLSRGARRSSLRAV